MNNESDYLIAACKESSSRVRRILIVSITASIIIFAAALSNRPKDWLNWGFIRMEAINDQIRDFPISSPNKDQDTKIKETRQYVYGLKEHFWEDFEKRIYIDVPFFGVRIDINDLGIVGGASLLVVALMLRSAMAREHDNLKVTFDVEDRSVLAERYKFLAMHQVITAVFIEVGLDGAASALTRILFWPMPLAYGCLVMIDLATAAHMDRHRVAYSTILAVELVILSALALISWDTHKLSKRLDSVWKSGEACFATFRT